MMEYRALGHVIVGIVALLVTTAARADAACPPDAAVPTPMQLQEALTKARDRGVLWRFEKDGRHGYLYGTIHTGKLEWAMPGRLLSRALGESDTIAMELDPTDPSVQKAMTATQAPEERPSLAAPLVNRLRALAGKTCVPWEMLEALPPALMVTTLALLDARWDGLDPGYASEFVLGGFARAAGKTVTTLETVSTQRGAIMGGSPAEQLSAVERAVSDLETGATRKVIGVIAQAWASGDIARLERYPEWCDCTRDPTERAALERLLFSRNPSIAARIEELHRSERRVFAATGILHMIGDRGLPRLLAERGFKVERVSFDER